MIAFWLAAGHDSPAGKEQRRLLCSERAAQVLVPGGFIFISDGTTPRGTGTGEKEALRVDKETGTAGYAQNSQGRWGSRGKTPDTGRGPMD